MYREKGEARNAKGPLSILSPPYKIRGFLYNWSPWLLSLVWNGDSGFELSSTPPILLPLLFFQKEKPQFQSSIHSSMHSQLQSGIDLIVFASITAYWMDWLFLMLFSCSSFVGRLKNLYCSYSIRVNSVASSFVLLNLWFQMYINTLLYHKRNRKHVVLDKRNRHENTNANYFGTLGAPVAW